MWEQDGKEDDYEVERLSAGVVEVMEIKKIKKRIRKGEAYACVHTQQKKQAYAKALGTGLTKTQN